MQKNRRRRLTAVAAVSTSAAGWVLTVPAVASAAPAYDIKPGQTVAVATNLHPGLGTVISSGVVSANGRYAAFSSSVDDLVTNDKNGQRDIFVRDLRTGAVRLVSVGLNGVAAGADGAEPSISADGRYVAFGSGATGLVKTPTSVYDDVFVRDLATNVTRLVTTRADGSAAVGGGYDPSISADGSRIACVSGASDLVDGDTNDANDIFVWDRHIGKSIRVSVGQGGVQSRPTTWEDDVYGYGYANAEPQISGNGQVVVFGSTARNLVADDTNFSTDIFIRDLKKKTTTRVSVATGGAQSGIGYKGIGGENPSISFNGDVVAFESYARGLASPEPFHDRNSYIHFVQANRTETVAETTEGGSGTPGALDPKVSPDGRYVAFDSWNSGFVPSDTDGVLDVFVRDLKTGAIKPVSESLSGHAGKDANTQPSISAGGRIVTFLSTERRSDSNGLDDNWGTLYAHRF